MASETWDFDKACPGLSIRTQGASRSYVVWFTVGGKRWQGLARERGRPDPGQGATEGKRDRARRPQRRRPSSGAPRRQAKAADSFGTMCGYLERRATAPRPRTYIETQRYLLRHWSPLHDMRSRASRAGTSLAGTSDPDRAWCGRCRESAGLPWDGVQLGHERGLVETNPISASRSTRGPPRSRPDPGRVGRGLARRGGGFRRAGQAVDLDRPAANRGCRHERADRPRARRLELTCGRAKNEREHEVPLSLQAMKLLAGAPGSVLVWSRRQDALLGVVEPRRGSTVRRHAPGRCTT